MQVLLRDALDVVDGDRVDALAIRLQLVQIEAVEHRVEHLQRDRARRLDRQREAAGQVRLRVGQLALLHALALQPHISSTISRSASPVVSDRVSVSATMSPVSFSALMSAEAP